MGTPDSSLGLKGFAGYNKNDPDPYTYDVAKAKQLFENSNRALAPA